MYITVLQVESPHTRFPTFATPATEFRITKDSVNGYLDADKNAGIAANGNTGVYTGYSSWLGKMYFQRYKDNQATAVTAGSGVEARNRYYVVLTGNAVTFL